MSPSNPFASPEAQINRDRYMRPLIVPPDGGPVEPYQRVTTFAKLVEDATGINKWRMRRVVYGLSQRPDLILSASAAGPDARRDLEKIAEKAEEVTDSGAASTGTALHSFIERLDNGENLGHVPEAYMADLRAYEALKRRHGIEVLMSERFVVHDGLRVAGTFDKVMTVAKGVEHIGVPGIGDNKTGKIDYPLGMAIQLGVYANARLYDIGNAERFPIHPDLDRQHGYIIWLPAGQGHAELKPLDIATGYDVGASAAAMVRELRKKRDWFFPLPGEEPSPLSLLEQLDAAETPDQLKAIYYANVDRWTDAHTARAAARNRILTHN